MKCNYLDCLPAKIRNTAASNVLTSCKQWPMREDNTAKPTNRTPTMINGVDKRISAEIIKKNIVLRVGFSLHSIFHKKKFIRMTNYDFIFQGIHLSHRNFVTGCTTGYTAFIKKWAWHNFHRWRYLMGAKLNIY